MHIDSFARAHTSQREASFFITGSTGQIGKHLSRTFTELCLAAVSGYRYVIPEQSEYLHPSFCDLANKQLLRTPLRGVESVLHLAWENSLQAKVMESTNLSCLANFHSYFLKKIFRDQQGISMM